VKKLTIPVKDTYPVYIGQNITDKLGTFIKEESIEGKCLVVTDSNVGPLYLSGILEILEEAGIKATGYSFPAGENRKNMDTMSDILEAMAAKELGRGDFVIALGGGVVGDLVGFAAGCYMRGIPFVQIPTTLLSMVDSSVGGKTGLNLSTGKNLAGLFHQPRLVVADINYLKTADSHTFSEGMAEIIKMAVLSGDEDFLRIRKFDGENEEALLEIIEAAVRYKASIVAQDPEEKGIRKCLNLGHTLAHPIETHSHNLISHGQAVAMGLAFMCRVSVEIGKMTRGDAEKIENELKRFKLKTMLPCDMEALLPYMTRDKKRTADGITLAIPIRCGSHYFYTYTFQEIRDLFLKVAE